MTDSSSVETIRDLQGLIRLKDEWNEIAPPDRVDPWQSYTWMKSAAEAFAEDGSLRIIVVRNSNKIAAIAPLVLKRSSQFMHPLQIHILGGEELKEPNRFIAADYASYDLLIDAIASQRVFPVRLSRIPMENGNVDYLRSKFRKKGWITQVMQMPYPCIGLTGNPIKRSLQNDLKRAQKKAEAAGEVTFEVVGNGDHVQIAGYLQKALAVEASGWKGRNGTAILSDAGRLDFFQRYASSALQDGILRLCFLSIEKVTAAVQFAVETGKNYWLLNVGYNEAFKKCSPGNLLLMESIKNAQRNALENYHLLGKDEPWTKRWMTHSMDCAVLAAYRPNYHGVKAMASDAFRLVRKRIRDRRIKESGSVKQAL